MSLVSEQFKKTKTVKRKPLETKPVSGVTRGRPECCRPYLYTVWRDGALVDVQWRHRGRMCVGLVNRNADDLDKYYPADWAKQ